MKAILIDALNHEIKEVTLNTEESTLKQWYQLIGCDLVEVAHYITEEDSILVDEEGLLKPQDHFFYYKGAHQPFAGNGLIVGVDEEGDDTSCKISLEEVIQNTEFLTRDDCLRHEYYNR